MRLDQLAADDRAEATTRMRLVLAGTAPVTPGDPADALAFVLRVIRTPRPPEETR